MIKTCQRCGTKFHAHGNKRFCVICSAAYHVEKAREQKRRARARKKEATK